jgi:hypothetical protein
LKFVPKAGIDVASGHLVWRAPFVWRTPTCSLREATLESRISAIGKGGRYHATSLFAGIMRTRKMARVIARAIAQLKLFQERRITKGWA